eukprot:SAG31_NODE_5919_length_2256_cov_2.107557_3_plen_32_part_00
MELIRVTGVVLVAIAGSVAVGAGRELELPVG